jgi:hypothetical protein
MDDNALLAQRRLTPFTDSVRSGIRGSGVLDNEHATWEKIATELDGIGGRLVISDIRAGGITGFWGGRSEGGHLTFVAEGKDATYRFGIGDVSGWRDRCIVRWTLAADWYSGHATVYGKRARLSELVDVILAGCRGEGPLDATLNADSCCVIL